MTDLKLKQKRSFETNKPIPRCWVTDCNYIVAASGPKEDLMYHVTAPQQRLPFAYTPNKAEVKKLIVTHKKLAEKNHGN